MCAKCVWILRNEDMNRLWRTILLLISWTCVIRFSCFYYFCKATWILRKRKIEYLFFRKLGFSSSPVYSIPEPFILDFQIMKIPSGATITSSIIDPWSPLTMFECNYPVLWTGSICEDRVLTLQVGIITSTFERHWCLDFSCRWAVLKFISVPLFKFTHLNMQQIQRHGAPQATFVKESLTRNIMRF